jgi:ADP-ribose pyrophosphatase YjhB (NUDIX family)
MHQYEFPRPAVATDIALFAIRDDALHVLLIRRGIDPFKGAWAFPGGFLLETETVEQCAHRELAEETGIGGVELCQIGVYSEPGRDPRGRVISCAFAGTTASDHPETIGGSDAAHAEWLAIEVLLGDENFEMAFDHREVLDDALHVLQRDIDQHIFGLLPEKFSLGTLHRAFELVLGTSVDRRNFAMKLRSETKKVSRATRLMDRLEIRNTGEMETGQAHRPGRLYTRAN